MLEEPPLPHGVFGSMGGLLTTAERSGQVRRISSFRMAAARRCRAGSGASLPRCARWRTCGRPSNLTARAAGGTLQASESRLWLRPARHHRLPLRTHRGARRRTAGLRFLHGVAAGLWRRHVRDGDADVFGTVRADQPRLGCDAEDRRPAEARVAADDRARSEMREHILNLWKRWDDAEAKQIAAMNFFLDAPSAQRQAEIRTLKDEVGECTDAGPVMPENWLRGQFNMTCAEGTVGAFFTHGADAAAGAAAPGVPKTVLAGRADGRSDGRAGRRVLFEVVHPGRVASGTSSGAGAASRPGGFGRRRASGSARRDCRHTRRFTSDVDCGKARSTTSRNDADRTCHMPQGGRRMRETGDDGRDGWRDGKTSLLSHLPSSFCHLP